MSGPLRNVALFAIMAGLLFIVAQVQSLSLALAILNLCLISAIMALGVNIQWGYAGLLNVGVMGFAALGGLAAVHQFIHIGDHAMVSGGSLVRKDVPPYTKGAKEPLSYVGINSIGLRRRGYSAKKIREIQEIYRILYQRNYNNTQAVEKIEAEMEATPERDEILLFIRNSQRGIMKGYWGG